jgi:hypothetical protein
MDNSFAVLTEPAIEGAARDANRLLYEYRGWMTRAELLRRLFPVHPEQQARLAIERLVRCGLIDKRTRALPMLAKSAGPYLSEAEIDKDLDSQIELRSMTEGTTEEEQMAWDSAFPARPSRNLTKPATDNEPTAAPARRRGRMTNEESDARRADFLATIRQHPTLKDEPAKLAEMVGISESTARRWMAQEEENYRRSIAANPPGGEE